MADETVKQENPNAETPKTFTQEEVNNIIAERLNRASSKYSDYEDLKKKAEEFDKLQEANKSELQKATERAAALESELTTLKRQNEVQAIRQKVSNDTGVPVSLLTADTEEACKAQADAINAYAAPNNDYPKVKDGGEVNGVPKNSTRDQFAEWFNNQT